MLLRRANRVAMLVWLEHFSVLGKFWRWRARVVEVRQVHF